MESQSRHVSVTAAMIVGYLAAWLAMTAALTLALRGFHSLRFLPDFHPFGKGPAFPNPLPYAALAMLISQAGRLLRKWVRS